MPDALKPDNVISPQGKTLWRSSPILRESVLALPNLVKLLARLLNDPRVPTKSKVLVFGTLTYLVVPIDVIPDIIPILGQTEDLLLIAFALNRLIRVAGEDVVLEHWDGSQDVLKLIRNITDVGASLVPKKVRLLLDRVGA